MTKTRTKFNDLFPLKNVDCAEDTAPIMREEQENSGHHVHYNGRCGGVSNALQAPLVPGVSALSLRLPRAFIAHPPKQKQL
jgi:hypothetical protein